MHLTVQSFSFIFAVSVAFFYFWKQANFLHRRVRGYGGMAAIDIGNHGIVMISQSLRHLTKATMIISWCFIFTHTLFEGVPQWVSLLWFGPLVLTIVHTMVARRYEDGWYESDDVKSKLRSV